MMVASSLHLIFPPTLYIKLELDTIVINELILPLLCHGYSIELYIII